MFGEYTYNRAPLKFNHLGGLGAGLNGTYSASHLVGGLAEACGGSGQSVIRCPADRRPMAGSARLLKRLIAVVLPEP